MSLLAQQVERLAKRLFEAAPPMHQIVDPNRFIETRDRTERSRLISEGVQRLKHYPRPRAFAVVRKPQVDMLLVQIAAWDLNPLEGADEMGLSIWGTMWLNGRRAHATLSPAPASFVSIHAINRIAERAPRTKPIDVYRLAFKFAALAQAAALIERQRNERDDEARHGGSYRLPIGQLLAKADLVITDDPDRRRLNMVTPWCDVRTVLPTTSTEELAQARACERALEVFDWTQAPPVDIPYIPRRGDSFTLGIAKGKLLS